MIRDLKALGVHEKEFELAIKSDVSVLILGETGTGKSELAKWIHVCSHFQNGPFVSIALSSLCESTFESELFGHEKGAFTGAQQKFLGKLFQAQGGTLFLDEIGELSPKQQVRLLEFLQSKCFTPLGSQKTHALNTRIIVATNQPLEQKVCEGHFRKDLFYRLQGIVFSLSSLTQRSESLDQWVHYFLEMFSKKYQKKILKISEKVAAFLEQYAWPGNLRELAQVLEYAVLSSEQEKIQVEDLPFYLKQRCFLGEKSQKTEERIDEEDYHLALARFEKRFLLKALQRYQGKINETARRIGLHKTTLIRRIHSYQLFEKMKEKEKEEKRNFFLALPGGVR